MRSAKAAIIAAIVFIAAAVAVAQRTCPGISLAGGSSITCVKTALVTFQITRDAGHVREVPMWTVSHSLGFFFVTGMAIDADGAPNAYHPTDSGLDELRNAGEPGNWSSLARDGDGNPVVQGDGDPFPGYYVSTTALADRTKSAHDPASYVDASRIPYIVLPRGVARQTGARLGDFALVFNQRNGKASYAIYADVGPPDIIGEGSIALADNLGVRSSPRRGGIGGGIVYLVFPGSGNGRPRSLDEISVEGGKLFEAWGGRTQLSACLAD